MNTQNLRAEQQILLCVAQRDLDAEAIVRLRKLLAHKVDWEYLRNISFAHGLLPLLASHVTSHCADLLPDALLAELKDELLANRTSCLYLVRELMRVLSQLKSDGIDAVTFKGPVLAQLAYADLGLRQAGDLDILIHPKDFHRAAEVLRKLAYEMEPQLTPAQQEAHLRFHCEIQFVNADNFSVVDLHWGITPKSFPLALTSDHFLANRKKVELAGHSVETFTDDDMIFYLSVHAAKSYFRKLEWIATFAELVRRNSQFSWDAVIAKARQAKAEKLLCLTFMLVERLYGLPLPAEFATLADSTELRDTVNKVLAFILANNAAPHGLPAFRWNRRFLSTRDAYLSLARATFVPTIADWQAFSIPDGLYPIYYLLRPLRLMTKYGRGAED